MKQKKNIADILSIWGSQFGAVIIAFVTQLILARALNISEYGAFMTAFNTAMLLGGIACFGAGPNWLRLIGKEGWNGLRWIKVNILLLVITTGIMVIGYLLMIPLTSTSSMTMVISICFLSIMIARSFSTPAEAVYQLEENYVKLSVLKFMNHGLKFLVVLICVGLSLSLSAIVIGYLITSILMLAWYIFLLMRAVKHRIHLVGHGEYNFNAIKKPSLKEAFFLLLPYGSTTVFYLIYFQGPIYLVNVLAGDENAAIYNVIFTVLNVLFLFPVTLYQSYLIPKIHRWTGSNISKIDLLTKVGSKISLLIGIAIGIPITILAPSVVEMAFGEEYRSAGIYIALLAIIVPLRLVSNNIGSVLVTEQFIKKKAIYQFYAAVLSVTLNLILLSFIGLKGAVYTLIVAESVVTILFLYCLFRHVKIHIQKSVYYLFVYILFVIGTISFYNAKNIVDDIIGIFIYSLLFIIIYIVIRNDKEIKGLFRKT